MLAEETSARGTHVLCSYDRDGVDPDNDIQCHFEYDHDGSDRDDITQ